MQLLAVALALLQSGVPAAPVPPAPPVSQALRDGEYFVLRCMVSVPLGEGAERVLVQKGFLEDGTVTTMSARWQEGTSQAVRRLPAGVTGLLLLEWSGENLQGRSLDWERGDLSVTLQGEPMRWLPPRAPEHVWRQTFVDRDRGREFHRDGGRAYFFGAQRRPSMASGFSSPLTPLGLQMSIGDVLAWGAGVPLLTVYETNVQIGREERRGALPPGGGMRTLLMEYDLDIALVRRRAEQIRAAMAAFEATITDYRQCTRQIDGGGEVSTGP